MKVENLKIVRDAFIKTKMSQKELHKLTVIAPSQINEILNGKRRFNNIKLAVWIEALTKGEVTAEWIINTDFADETLTLINEERVQARGKLESIKQDLLEKIKSIT